MTLFVTINLVMFLMSMCIHLWCLAFDVRDKPLSQGSRVFVLVIQLGFAMWAAYLLLKGTP